MKDKVIIITGPTASGKSDIAIKLAKLIDGEIISSDSQQIYRDMNIGTNKVTKEESLGIKHHLIDIINPNEEYSVQNFSNDCRNLIKDISNRNKSPIIVGGTGFYIDSILYNLNYGAVKKDNSIRDKYENLADKYGNYYIYDILKKIDPTTALKYHPNEKKRIIRSLEIYEKTGVIPSKAKTGKRELNDEIDPFVFFINYKDRNLLYEKINKRVSMMIDDGLISETRNLIDKYDLDENSRSLLAIGYKETYDYIKGKISLDELEYNIRINTRHYAKRQITWMKKYIDYNDKSYLLYREDYKSKEELIEKINKLWVNNGN
ncbi:MAG: tRNA (adenosine(37)-N6)-dimethylallyltransferase MiaA [Tissierellia bacterium]|nr:tRNA (adenosine(37)-N6)-dimethylallyltransferase MiaA [Tissierellia bacterium]